MFAHELRITVKLKIGIDLSLQKWKAIKYSIFSVMVKEIINSLRNMPTPSSIASITSSKTQILEADVHSRITSVLNRRQLEYIITSFPKLI